MDAHADSLEGKVVLVVAFHHTGSTLLRRLLGGSSVVVEHYRDAASEKVGIIPCEWLHPCSRAAHAQSCGRRAGQRLVQGSQMIAQASVPVVVSKKTINDDGLQRALQWSADMLALPNYEPGVGGCQQLGNETHPSVSYPRIRWSVQAMITLIRDPMDTTWSLMKRMLGVDAAFSASQRPAHRVATREFHTGAWESLGRSAALSTAAPWQGSQHLLAWQSRTALLPSTPNPKTPPPASPHGTVLRRQRELKYGGDGAHNVRRFSNIHGRSDARTTTLAARSRSRSRSPEPGHATGEPTSTSRAPVSVSDRRLAELGALRQLEPVAFSAERAALIPCVPPIDTVTAETDFFHDILVLAGAGAKGRTLQGATDGAPRTRVMPDLAEQDQQQTRGLQVDEDEERTGSGSGSGSGSGMGIQWVRTPLVRGVLARALPAIPVVYERLVAHPEPVLRHVCEQLQARGVQILFESSMLRPEHPRIGDGRANGIGSYNRSQLLRSNDTLPGAGARGDNPLQATAHGLYRASQVRQPLTAGRVGAWRREAPSAVKMLLARLDRSARRLHPSAMLSGGGVQDSCWGTHEAEAEHPEVSHDLIRQDIRPKYPDWRLPSRAYGGAPGLFLGDPRDDLVENDCMGFSARASQGLEEKSEGQRTDAAARQQASGNGTSAIPWEDPAVPRPAGDGAYWRFVRRVVDCKQPVAMCRQAAAWGRGNCRGREQGRG